MKRIFSLFPSLRASISLLLTSSIIVLIATSCAVNTAELQRERDSTISDVLDIKLPLPEGFSIARADRIPEHNWYEIVIGDSESKMLIELGRKQTSDASDAIAKEEGAEAAKIANFRKTGTFKTRLGGNDVLVVEGLKNTANGPDTPTYQIKVPRPELSSEFYLEAYSPNDQPVDKKRFQIFLDTINRVK